MSRLVVLDKREQTAPQERVNILHAPVMKEPKTIDRLAGLAEEILLISSPQKSSLHRLIFIAQNME